MERLKVCESEYRLCQFVWENEPMSRKELARLCKEKLGWSRSTVYRVIDRLAERGVLKSDGSAVTSLVEKESVLRFDSSEMRTPRFRGWFGTFVSACPIAFGEIGVKQRVVNSITYKKPAFWVIILAVIVAIVLALLFFTGPSGDDVRENESSVNESAAAVDTSDGSSDSSEQSRSEDSSTDNSEPTLSSVAVDFTQYIFGGGKFEENDSSSDHLAKELIVTDKDMLDTLVSKCDSTATFEEFDGSIHDYVKTLPEDFFDNNALIAVPVSSPAQVTYFNIDRIARFSDNRVIISVQRDEGLDTAMQYNLLVAVISKSDIEGCTEFLVSDETAELVWYSGKVSAQSGSGDTEKVIEITDAEAKKLRRILNRGAWTANTAESTGTHDLTVGERKLSYNSVGGIIVDTERGYTLTLSADEKIVFDSALEQKEEETENETVYLNGKQKTHQTPENLYVASDNSSYYFGKISPIYFELADVDKMFIRQGDRGKVQLGETTYDVIKKGLIKESGNIMWICNEQGKKIDYVYSNSDGIFRFECPAGTFTFLFESDIYADKLVGPYTFDGYYEPLPYTTVPYDHVCKITTYHDVYENFKIKVIDSVTKQPLRKVKITLSEISTYTDSEGFVTYKPLLHYVKDRSSVFYLQCELTGYLTVYDKAYLYETYKILEMEPVEKFDFSITVVDKNTGKPVSGVRVGYWNKSDPETYLNNMVTGEDGIISGRASNIDLDGNLEVYLMYTGTYTRDNGEIFEYSTETAIYIEANEIHIYVDFELTPYGHSMSRRR